MSEQQRPWRKVVGDGVTTLELESWSAFYEAVHVMHEARDYVFRGQRRTDWPVWSNLDRLCDQLKDAGLGLDRKGHLERFKRATRGRRGPNPPELKSDNDWWALGQHFGLATPLLDWTTAPFVAAYFAFFGNGNLGPDNQRAIYALSEKAVEAVQKNFQVRALIALNTATKTNPKQWWELEFFRPVSDENPRLLNQGGLFTIMHEGDDVESWVRRQFPGPTAGDVLLKILLPNEDRLQALRDLNRMNINHLSLFPDLSGASIYTNMDFTTHNY